MKEGASPQNWFQKFEIFPTDGLEFNDPSLVDNSIKTIGKDAKPIYTFKIVKQ